MSLQYYSVARHAVPNNSDTSKTLLGCCEQYMFTKQWLDVLSSGLVIINTIHLKTHSLIEGPINYTDMTSKQSLTDTHNQYINTIVTIVIISVIEVHSGRF